MSSKGYIYFKSYKIVSDVVEVQILKLNPVGEGRDPVRGVETLVLRRVDPGELVLALLAPLVDQLLVVLQLLLLVPDIVAVIVVTHEGVQQLGVLGQFLQRLQDKGTLAAGEMMVLLDVVIQSFFSVELILAALRSTFLFMLSLKMIFNFSGGFEHFLAVEAFLQMSHPVFVQLSLGVELLLTLIALDNMDRVLVDTQRTAGREAPPALITDVSLGSTGSWLSNTNRGPGGTTWSWRSWRSRRSWGSWRSSGSCWSPFY